MDLKEQKKKLYDENVPYALKEVKTYDDFLYSLNYTFYAFGFGSGNYCNKCYETGIIAKDRAMGHTVKCECRYNGLEKAKDRARRRSVE